MANESANANDVSTTTTNANGGEVTVTLVDGVCVVTSEDATQSLTAPIIIEKPAAGDTAQIDVVPGQKYFFDFNENNVGSFVQEDGDLTLNFTDGSSIVLKGFGSASEGVLPAKLAFSDALSADELNTLIQVVDTTPAQDELEEPQAELREGEDEVASTETTDGEGEGTQVASIEPAAGEQPSAQDVASIEPAAGDDAGGNENSGFSFENFSSEAVGALDAVGPIDPTLLQYGVEFQNEDLFPNDDQDQPEDGRPTLLSPAPQSLDETFLGPLSVSDTLPLDFGADGPGSVFFDGTNTSGGSLLGGNLTSSGDPITLIQNATNDVITGELADGTVIFDIVLNTATGEYTFTQYAPIDHDDATDPNDVIQFTFGVRAEDADGDAATTDIVINVLDDAPLVPAPDENTRDESILKTMDIVINDTLVVDFGNDVEGTVTPTTGQPASVTGVPTLTSGGDVITITQTADGYEGTLPGGGEAFTLVIDPATGAYTYTQKVPFDHNPANDTISLEFPVTVTDYDGDTAATTITVNITDSTPKFENDTPKLGDGLEVVDETDLPGVTVTNKISVDFGADVPGAVSASDTFSFSGSALGGNLTSNGDTVNVELVGDTYIGYTGPDVATGTQIFTLQIQSDGTYTFDLFGTLDHADPNDPNDIIDLTFGVQVEDADGDVATSTVIIKVKDDVPTIGDSRGDVDETNLDGGPLTYSDTLITSFGNEVGTISPNGAGVAEVGGVPVTLMSNGEVVTISQTASGYEGTVPGSATPVFTLTINPDTGKYDYVQNTTFDHPDGLDPNDTIELVFGVDVTSVDGDSDSGEITISVADDGPVANDDTTGAEEGQTITGDVTANDDFSQDVENTVTEFTIGTDTYTIPAGGSETVVTPLGEFTLNSDGTYTFTATDVGDPDGTLDVTYTLVDGDDDSDTAVLSIRVTPDGEPIAVTETMTVDETNLTPGPLVINETLTVDFGLDGAGSIDPNGVSSFGGSAKDGNLTSGGQSVEIRATANGYEGVLAGTDTQVFELIVQDSGDYSFELFKTLDHEDATDPNDLIQLNFGITIADADNDTADGTITINVLDDAPVAFDDGNTVLENTLVTTGNVVDNDIEGEDAPSTVTSITFGTNTVDVVAGTPTSITGDHGTLVINADGSYEYTSFGTNVNTEVDVFTYALTDFDGDTDTAELSITIEDINVKPVIEPGFVVVDETNLPGEFVEGQLVVDFGADAPGEVTPNDSFTSGGSQLGGDLTSGGQPVAVRLEGDTYIGETPDGTDIFTLEVNPDGSYRFDLIGTLDHADPNDPNDIITLEFGVNATDADGDVVPSVILVNVLDDVPVIGDSRGDVDETNLDVGDLTYSDTLFTDYGTEATSFAPDGGVRAEVNGNPITLTSDGETITFVQVADGYEGQLPGGAAVFTLVMDDTTGKYTYTQVAPFDHPDGTDPNDTIDLFFDFVVENTDGDTDTGTVQITVADDGPIANDDVTGAEEGQNITGNVTTNDDFSEDTPNTVTEVEFGGSTYPISSGSPAVIATTLGTLTLNLDGSYTFEAVDSGDPDGTLNFTYTLLDGDGDTDTANLSIKVTPDGAPILVTGADLVDETGLDGGPVSVNGDLNVDFGADGAGEVNPNGTTSFGGSVANGNLTSNDVPVEIRETADGYEGVLVGTDTQVFDLTLQDNGEYTFTLIGPLDHADGSDPNDAILLNFGVTASDADNDGVDGTLTITVLDDAPIANDDCNEFEITATGQDYNVVMVLDVSGSMAGDQIALLKSSVSNLLSDFNGYNGGEVKVHLVPFATNAGVGQTFTITDASGFNDALNFIDGLNADGFTNYEAPLQSAISWLNGDTANDPIAGGETLTYFISDGEPNRYVNNSGNVVNPPGTLAEEEAIIQAELTGTSVTTSDGTFGDNTDEIGTLQGLSDNVIAVGIGVGNNSNLNLIDSSGTAIYIDDANDLYATFQATNPLTGSASGNVITGENGGPGAADDLSQDDDTPESADHDVVQVKFGTTVVDIPAGGSNTIEGDFGILEMFDDGSYTYTLKPGATIGTGGSDTLDPNSGDVAGTQTSFTKNNITVTSKTGTDLTWLNNTGTGIGVGGDQKVWPSPDALEVNFDLAESVTFKIGDIGSNNQTSDLRFDLYFQDGSSETVIFDIASTTPVNGIVQVTFDSSDFGGKLIDYVDLPYHQSSFVLNDVIVQYPGDDCIIDEFEYVLQDGDGDQDTAILKLKGKDVTTDVPNLQTSDVTVDETLLDPIDEADNAITADFGNDGPGTYALIGLDSFDGAENNQLTSNGVDVIVGNEGGDLVGRAGGDEIFRLSLNETTGEYEFILSGTLDHADETNPDDIIELNFNVSATDSDGDSDTGIITVSVKDDGPFIESKAKPIDEDGLVDGPISYTHTLNYSYGEDGAGEIRANDKFMATFEVGGNAQQLTSNNVAIVVELTATGYVGKAGGETVFTLDIQNDGEYTYTQFKAIDHPDEKDPNDVIWLKFGVEIVDFDGDTDEATIIVDVADGGPVAHDDTESFGICDDQGFVEGDVIANDEVGPDVPGSITNVKFGGQNYAVDAQNGATVKGQYGELKIEADGSYEYQLYDVPTGGPDQTVYTYSIDNPAGGDAAGDIKNVDVSYNETTETLSFEMTIGGTPDGFTVAINDGPNPKGAPNELALFYFDRNGGDPVVSVYNYNGKNTQTSWDGGQQIATSLAASSPFLSINETTDANGNRVFSFEVDAGFIQDFYATDPTWVGVDVADKIGMWLHPVDHLDSSYDHNGYLTEWDAGKMSWYDSHNQLTDKEIIDGKDCATGGCEKSLDPNASDVDGIQESFSKDGITVSVANHGDYDIVWMNTHVGSGLGIDNLSNGDSTKVWPMGETFDISVDEPADSIEITIAELGDNNDDGYHGADYTIRFADGSTAHAEQQYVADEIDGGLFTFTVDSADYGGKLISSISLNSINDGDYKGASFLLNNVKATCPGDEVLETVDVFKYTLTDADGDTSTAFLTLKGAGPQSITGTDGDDVIAGGGDSDWLYGGEGADTFLYESINEGVDTIADFDASEGDVVDVSGLLQGYNALQDSIDSFVFTTESGGNTTISVDPAGSGNAANATQIAVLESVTGLSIEQITDNGNTTV